MYQRYRYIYSIRRSLLGQLPVVCSNMFSLLQRQECLCFIVSLGTWRSMASSDECSLLSTISSMRLPSCHLPDPFLTLTSTST